MDKRQRHQVTLMQLEVLWEHLNSNKEVAAGFNRSIAARANYQTMWQSVADILNSFGEGATKDSKGWAKYWVDYKSKLKKRVKDFVTQEELLDIEKKFLLLINEPSGASPVDVHMKQEPSMGEDNITVEPDEVTATHHIIVPDLTTHQVYQDCKNIVHPVQITQTQSDEVGSDENCSDNGSASIASNHSRNQIRGGSGIALKKSRQRRRPPAFTAEAARRELIHISRLRADTEARNTAILEKMANVWEGIQQSLTRIEARLSEKSPR